MIWVTMKWFGPVFHHGWHGGRPMNLGLSTALGVGVIPNPTPTPSLISWSGYFQLRFATVWDSSLRNQINNSYETDYTVLGIKWVLVFRGEGF